MSKAIAGLKNVLIFYKIIIVTIVIVILFMQVALSKVLSLPNFIDELILAGFLLYSLFRAFDDLVVRRLMLLYLSAFVFFMLISVPSIPSRGITSTLLQTFIHLKFILFVSFLWTALGEKHSNKVSYILITITIVFLIVNLFSGSFFNILFDLPIQQRGWGYRPVGIQADTASLGTTLAFFGCLIITGTKDFPTKVKVLLLIVFSFLVLISTVRTALLLIPLIILWWLKDSLKSFLIALIFIVAASIIFKSNKYVDELIDITVQNIEWTIEDPLANSSSYIRGIMIYFSFELANDRFPIGTGSATYGTVMSDDSHIYAELGLQNSRFFVEKEGIYDSNFASLLGEFGYLGLIVYFAIFYFVMQTPLSVGKCKNETEFRFVFFLLVCGYSIATPIFMNTYPAFISALVLVSSYKKINNT